MAQTVSDEIIMSSLIAAGSIRAAAKSANVSEATIKSRLNDPAFREQYNSLRVNILQETAAGLTARLETAINALADIICDELNPVSVRVSAADSLLRHGLRYHSAAVLEARIAALEEAAQYDTA